MQRREFLQHSATALLASGLPLTAYSRTRNPIANSTYGKLRGQEEHGVHAFRAIPYGADTSKRRFRPPLPPVPWSGVRDALQYGNRSPQHGPLRSSPRREGYFLPPDLGSVSEDCLQLNLWTTGLRDGRLRPVLVYIHGGAYSNGSANNSLYEGFRLCRRGDAVVVTINHRLNLFGYLYLAEFLPELADSGNVGMLDLVLALQWIQQNIEDFGGDPGRVTICGQSGGGAKCATLMAMPAAQGLFHRVWTMSGQQITASRPASASARTAAVLQAAGLNRERVAQILTLPMEQLITAGVAADYFGPVHDGRTLPSDPFDPVAPAISASVPMVLGNTHDETRGLIGGADPTLFHLEWEDLPGRLSVISRFLGNLSPHQVVQRYREIYPDRSATDIFFAITTAFRSWRGQLIEAERRAEDPQSASRTWVYELDWKSPVDQGKWGAPHTLDIPLVLDNTALAPGMSGDGAEARRMSSIMSHTLLSFMTNGDPNDGDLPKWLPYSGIARETMCFRLPPEQVQDPRGAERRLIEQVPYLQPGT